MGYLRERWSPRNGRANAIYTGWAPSVEVAAGRSLLPRLVVGGMWQSAVAVNPNESYLGTSYDLSDTLKLVDTFSVFGDYLLAPRIRLHAGAAVGIVAASTWDTYTGGKATSWGAAFSPYIGYDRQLSRAWSIGVIGRLSLYRSGVNETPSSASRLGLLPSVLLAFTFN